MARPARVRIRSRKPCVRARRRLFGWKVRLPLLTVDSPGRRHGSRPAVGLLNVLWTERAGPRWCSTVRAQGTTVGGHGSHQGTQRRERGSNRPGTADRPNLLPRRVANATRPVTPPHLASQRRLVSEGPCRLACPLTARSGGILSLRPPSGPETRRRARPRTVYTQVWTGLGMVDAPTLSWMRRPPRQSRRERRKGCGRGRSARRAGVRVEPRDRGSVRYLGGLRCLRAVGAAARIPAPDPPARSHRRHRAAGRPERVRQGRDRADPAPADQ